MKRILVTMLMCCCFAFGCLAFGRSAPAGTVSSYQINLCRSADPNYNWPYWYYTLDQYNQLDFASFAPIVTVYDFQGVQINQPIFQVNIARVATQLWNYCDPVVDSIVRGWPSQPVSGGGEGSITLYPSKDGYCIFGLNGVFLGDVTRVAIGENIYYDVSVPSLWTTSIVSVWVKSQIAYPPPQSYATVMYPWGDILQPCNYPSSIASAAGMEQNFDSNNILWSKPMYEIRIGKLNAESSAKLQSYTVSFVSSYQGNTMPVFLVGYDSNNVPHYTLMKATRQGNRFVTSRFMPTDRSVSGQYYYDPITDTQYSTVWSASGFDVESASMQQFIHEWLTVGIRYDIDADGIVGFKDYALMCERGY